MMGLAMDQAAKDIAGAADYLAGRPEVTGKVGAVGLLHGRQPGPLVGHALRADRRRPSASTRALPWERMRPDWADYAGKAALIHCSEEDGTSAAAGVQTARRRHRGGRRHLPRSTTTRARTHAFFNDDRPEVVRRSAAAASAWARTLELFRTKLG